MTTPNPFTRSVFDGDPRVTPKGTALLYRHEQQRLMTAISDSADGTTQSGRILMLSGREAGVGKSHLLARAISENAAEKRALPIVFNRETAPTWTELFRQSLLLLAGPDPCSSISALSDTARRLFAELIGELIQNGTVPSENPGRARRGLEQNYAQLLDLRGNSPIANWLVENSGALVTPLAKSLQRRTKMGEAACRDWVEFLIQFESGFGEVPVPESFARGEGEAKAHMRHLGQLVSRYRPLLLVFDHLDAFYRDNESALSAGYLFSELARIGVAPLTIIAMNDDLWRESFANSLPSAIADRLTEQKIVLSGLGIDDAQSLLEARLHESGVEGARANQMVEAVDLDGLFRARNGSAISPREVLRHASSIWENNGETTHTADAGDVPPTPAKETLGRIQAMLRQFNQRKPVDPAGAEPTPATGNEPSPWPKVPDDAPDALRDFAAERESIYFGADLLFEPGAIRHTLELAGRRSPLLDYREFHVAGGTDAACWRSPDHEILFGFEPADRTPYWRALVEQAGESPLGRAKVVAFTPPGTPSFETDGLNGHAQDRLDVLELDRCALASIAAAEQVVGSSSNEEETFAQIAPELDFLWRRITRPMGV